MFELFAELPPPVEDDEDEDEWGDEIIGDTIPPGVAEQLRQAEQKRRDKNGNPHGNWWESSDDYR